jgi:magnesium transporter
MWVFTYDEKTLNEKQVKTIDECLQVPKVRKMTWINIDGLGDVEAIAKLGDCFGLDAHVVEDILATEQRPRTVEYEHYTYIVMKQLHYEGEKKQLWPEQISLVLGPNFLLSFQESEGDPFETARDWLRTDKGHIRRRGIPYLAYSLLDAIVDSYFGFLEEFGDDIEDAEGEVVENPDQETVRDIYRLRRTVLTVRTSIYPLREVIGHLQRADAIRGAKTTSLYLQDIHDHAVLVIDTVETFREMLGEMMDAYLTSLSNKLNEIMKVLTIITTIFIPMSLIASIYGMNFVYMPEIYNPLAYPLVWLAMLTIALLMIAYFRRKHWL